MRFGAMRSGLRVDTVEIRPVLEIPNLPAMRCAQ